MDMVARLLWGTALVALVGCAAHRGAEPLRMSSVRSRPIGLEEAHLTIPRARLVALLEGSKNSYGLRVVPVLSGASGNSGTPEYRLFEVREKSVASLLGLKNADVLVAANDYVVQEPIQFHAYLYALRSQKEAQIEIRRGGKPLLLRYTFTED